MPPGQAPLQTVKITAVKCMEFDGLGKIAFL